MKTDNLVIVYSREYLEHRRAVGLTFTFHPPYGKGAQNQVRWFLDFHRNVDRSHHKEESYWLPLLSLTENIYQFPFVQSNPLSL